MVHHDRVHEFVEFKGVDSPCLVLVDFLNHILGLVRVDVDAQGSHSLYYLVSADGTRIVLVEFLKQVLDFGMHVALDVKRDGVLFLFL